MKICGNCGYENIDEAQFCRNCGKKIETSNSDVRPIDNVKVIVGNDKRSIISKLFFKIDKYDGNLRFAKTKSISIIVFLVFFIFGIAIDFSYASLDVLIIASILVGLAFSLPIFIIGTIIGWIINRLKH